MRIAAALACVACAVAIPATAGAATSPIEWTQSLPPAAAPTQPAINVLVSLDAVTSLTDGGSIDSGFFQGAGIDLGDGTPRDALNTGNGMTPFVRSVTSSGAVQWISTPTLATGSDSAFGDASGVASFADGSGAIAVGYFTGTGVMFGSSGPFDSADSGQVNSAFFQRLNADGSTRWAFVTGTSDPASETEAEDAATYADGSVVVCGYFIGAGVVFGVDTHGSNVVATSLNSGTSQSSFVVKLDADGKVVWLETAQSPGASLADAASIAALPDGGALVSGYFLGTDIDLGDGVPRTSAGSGAGYTSFVQRLDSSGATTRVLATTTDDPVGNSFGYGISALPDGSAVVTGTFTGNHVDLGDGVLRSSANSGASSSAYTQKLTADGSTSWVVASTAPGASNASALEPALFDDGGSVVTGWFQGTGVDLGDGVLRTSADQSAFTANVSANGTVLRVIASSSTATPSYTSGSGVSAHADGTAEVVGTYQGEHIDVGDGVVRDNPWAWAGGASMFAYHQRLTAVAGGDDPVPPVTPAARVRATSITAARGVVRVTMRSTGPGRAVLTGRSHGKVVCVGRARFSAAGRRTVTCTPTALLARMRARGPVVVRLALVFTPTHGRTQHLRLRSIRLQRIAGAGEPVTG